MQNKTKKMFFPKIAIFIDYEYDFYGYSDYRGAYTDSYYDDFYRTYDGEYFFDYPPGGVAPLPPGAAGGGGPVAGAAGGLPRTARTNVVGF